MKTLLIISIFCCIAFASFSQEITWFKGISLDSAKLISDNIVSMATTKYKFYKVSAAEKEGDYQVFRYIKEGTENKPELINIAFQFYNDGKPTYYLKRIPEISLTDIFPFWKKYVDPSADIAEITSKYQADYVFKDKGGARITKCILDKENEGWMFWVN